MRGFIPEAEIYEFSLNHSKKYLSFILERDIELWAFSYPWFDISKSRYFPQQYTKDWEKNFKCQFQLYSMIIGLSSSSPFYWNLLGIFCL